MNQSLNIIDHKNSEQRDYCFNSHEHIIEFIEAQKRIN